MKSRSELWLRVLEESGTRCSVSTAYDVKTVMSRVESEGESFFTLTLPQFSKDLERALEDGVIHTQLFRGFARNKSRVTVTLPDGQLQPNTVAGGIPQFLGGFLDLIFSSRWEVTYDEWTTTCNIVKSSSLPDHNFFPPLIRIPKDLEEELMMAEAIMCVRQLCSLFSKEKSLCTEDKIDAAYEAYAVVDEEIKDPFADGRIVQIMHDLPEVKKVFDVVFGPSLSSLDGMIYAGELKPKHGPGNTSDRLLGNQKWDFKTWNDRLEPLFPFVEYGVPNFRYWSESEGIMFLDESMELPARLVAVPKTAKTPRLIAIEPVCMQYIQQSMAGPLVDLLEQDDLAKWFVGFSEQWPNQAMAQIGSEDGSLATLDLSEASDRVPNWLVEELLLNYPHVNEGVQACRSKRVQLPSGKIIHLQKFASMGSALTFPLEAMVFTAVAIASVLRASRLPVSKGYLHSLKDRVRVYGDDIIVPTDMAVSVIGDLEAFGFKVNRTKSFWTGEFRESCGKEYWKGHDVSIVKVRKQFPTSQRDVDEIVSSVATRNLLYKAGFRLASDWYDELLLPLLKGKFPVVHETSPVLGRTNDSAFYQVDFIDDATHSPMVNGWVVKPKIPFNEIDGVPALMKCLLEIIGMPNADERHLTRSGRPRAVSIKLARARPF